MKRLIPKSVFIVENEFPKDVDRIVRVAREHGYVITREHAEEIWFRYSDDMFAGWLFLPELDSDLWEIVKHLAEEIGD